MANKFVAAFSLCFCLCMPLHAQNIADILFGKDNKQSYMGQYNYNGKRKNGFGIERYKNGSVYIGDFSENDITGRGMLIAQNSGISNVKGATVYVGSWRKGKKDGRGVCYDVSGKQVFNGRFAADKPLTAATSADNNCCFAISDNGNEVYLGEMSGNTKDGFGLTLKDNGEIIYGTIKNGVRQGIGMIFFSPEAWQAGRWTDGNFTAFNNSEKANADIASFRASNKESHREMRSSLLSAAESFTQAGLNTVTMVNGTNTMVNGTNGGGQIAALDDIDDGPVVSGRSKDYYQTMYDRYEWKAKNTFEDRVRHKSTAKTSGDFRVAASDAKLLRTYQNGMRQTRALARKEGFILKESKYETISF